MNWAQAASLRQRGETHVSIKVKEGIPQEELGERLAKTQSEWKKAPNKKKCTT